jgi:hypothetical protein
MMTVMRLLRNLEASMRNAFYVAALLASLSASPASADLLEAHFTGTTGANLGFYSAGTFGCPVVTSGGCTFPAGTPFTATFDFDTSLGVLSSPSPGVFDLTGGLVSATLAVAGVGNFSNTGSDLNVLEWQADTLGNLIPIESVAQDGGGFREIAFSGSSGFFQSGTCPGRPCSALSATSENLTDLSTVSVPGPILGAGLPGIVLFGAAVGWLRRQRQRVPTGF